ncbi:hypothetical protein [Dactylosporangium sp. CA-139066]|uniref:hypothetical protein n=1 Tax=Dactylosporangium sp. CA-139066 TaxID=3239930 RepID=UPI003D91FEBE
MTDVMGPPGTQRAPGRQMARAGGRWGRLWRRIARLLPRRRATPPARPGVRGRQHLAAAAERRGYADAVGGMFDQWSFDDRTLLPYLRTLRAQGEREIAETRQALADTARRESLADNRADADVEVLERRLAFLERLYEEAQQMSRRALARMDRIATREARRRRLFRVFTRRRQPNETEAEIAQRRADIERLQQQLGVAPMTEISPWEGPTPPPISPVVRWLTLLGLVAVELPVTYFVFAYFHGTDQFEQFMTWVFAVPVAFVMVMFPHLAGVLVRYRHATGREWLWPIIASLLISPWGYLAYELGSLRAKVLLQPAIDPDTGRPFDDPRTHQPLPTLADQLHVEPRTIVVVFICVMILTGGIGMLLGLAHDHPVRTAHRRAERARLRLERRLAAFRPIVRPAPTLTPEQRIERDADIARSVRAAFVAAEHAYLDGIARAMSDPAVTEAIARMSDRLANEREDGFQRIPRQPTAEPFEEPTGGAA